MEIGDTPSTKVGGFLYIMRYLEGYEPVVKLSGLNTLKDAYFGGDVTVIGTLNGRNVTNIFTTVGASNADYITDGTADDVQINAAIVAVSAAGGGVVLVKSGTYTLAQSVKPKSNVQLRGEGMFTTTFTTTNTFSGGIIADTTFTTSDPLTGFVCSDLELDGSNMPTSPYSIGRKGIDSHNLRHCVFRNLYIHNCPASGLGVDNLDRCLIDHCIIVMCGTSGQAQGSNGVGIGTGGMPSESFIVTNCITESTANSAYLCEELDSTTTNRHYIFANNISYGDFKGFSISGASDVIIANNQVYNSQDDGIRAIVFSGHTATRVSILGNEVDGSVSEGIYIDTGVTDCKVEGNRVLNGTIEGMVIRGSRTLVRGNHIRANGKTGIFLGAAAGGSAISHVDISNNMVYNNAAITANTDGIRVDATSAALSDITICGNHSFDDQGTPTQRYGIIVTGNSALTNLSIRQNETVSNKTAGLFNNAAGTIVGLSIRDNYGINPALLYAQGNVTGATTFNRANGEHITATLTGSITVTLTAGVSAGDTLTLELTQDGTGSRTATWPSNFKKAGGTLTLSTGAAAVDIISMRYDGTNWVETSRALNVS